MAFPAFYIFQNFPGEDPRTPLIKTIQQLNPQNLSSTITAAKGKKKAKKPSPIKTIYKRFIFRLYRNWKKGGGRWGKIFFVWFVIWLFETLMSAIAEDKVCDSCIVSSWALLIFLLCLWWPNSNFLCCVITQNGESSRGLLLSVTNRTALAPGWGAGGEWGRGHSPQEPPLKYSLCYYQSLSHNFTHNWVLVGKKVLPFNWCLKLFNCQIFSQLAFGIKGCSSETRFISSIFRLLCIALWHYVREHIIYTVYSDCVLVFTFAFLSWKKNLL